MCGGGVSNKGVRGKEQNSHLDSDGLMDSKDI